MPAGPVEEFLDHLPVARLATNTIDPVICDIAGPLVAVQGRDRAGVDQVTLPSSTPYVAALRTGYPTGVAALRTGYPAG